MKAVDRLHAKIEAFVESEMKQPTCLTLHSKAYMQLRYELAPSYTAGVSGPEPVMGMKVQIDNSKEVDFMEVGID